MIKTKFQELVGSKYPIIQAGMGPYATSKLCAAAAKAGSLMAQYDPTGYLSRELDTILNINDDTYTEAIKTLKEFKKHSLRSP